MSLVRFQQPVPQNHSPKGGCFCYTMDTMKSCLIIVNGLPATGKTTFGNKLAKELKLPIFRKDDIKEAVADQIVEITAVEALRLGLFSRVMINYIVNQLKSGQSYILDSNFSPGQQTDAFIEIVKDFNIVEIFLKADGEVLFKRFLERKSNRHPVHLEHYLEPGKFEETITKGLLQPLKLGAVIEIDTTDFEKVDWDRVVDQVRKLL